MITTLVVALFGGLGAVARAELADRHGAQRGTILANIAGAALLGLVVGLVAGGTIPGAMGRIVGIGFAGGFTTFSTWMLLAAADPQRELPRLAGQLGLGMLVAGLGWTVGWMIPV